MSLNNYFDKIYCISLLEREDKKKIIEEKFKKLNIEVEFYRPVVHNYNPKLVKSLVESKTCHFNIQHPNEIGAAYSHFHVIKTAYLSGVEKLFVFEDDLKFIKNWEERLDKYMTLAPKDWDLLLFYSFMYNIEPQNIKVNSRWMRAYNSWSLTSYGCNRKFMEEYIKQQESYFRIADLVSYQICNDNKFNCYVSTPGLCIPNTDLESNIRKEMNYKNTPSVIQLGFNESNYE